MTLIDGDRIITAQLYDDEHEEFTEKKMSIIDCINAYTDEGVTEADVVEQTRWIPCSERLPNFPDVYIVTRHYPNNVLNPNYLVDACFFDGSNWYNDNRINHERNYADNVIAWQENPEPYKAESEDKE